MLFFIVDVHIFLFIATFDDIEKTSNVIVKFKIVCVDKEDYLFVYY